MNIYDGAFDGILSDTLTIPDSNNIYNFIGWVNEGDEWRREL